jgi:TIR domain
MGVKEENKHIEIFCCYARKDQRLLTELKNHLKLWERLQLITVWTDTDISAGADWQKEIMHHLNSAQIILLLVSPDFLASEYCYSTEMTYAMERYERGQALVIPIILRSCAWEEAPFGRLQVLPTDAKPVIGSGWHNQDEAFFNVAEGIRKAAEKMRITSLQGSTFTKNYDVTLSDSGEIREYSERQDSFSVFISYARADGRIEADCLHSALSQNGIPSWRDERDLNPYQDFSVNLIIKWADC